MGPMAIAERLQQRTGLVRGMYVGSVDVFRE